MWIDRHLPRNKWVRSALFLAFDMGAVALCSFFALWIRFDLSFQVIPEGYLSAAQSLLLRNMVITALVFAAGRMYSTMWGAAGVREICQITGLSLIHI